MASNKSYSSYEAMSFDIYGTLVDWETGISASLSQLTSKLPDSHPCKDSLDKVIDVFNKYENPLLKNHPDMVYEDILKHAYLGMAKEWGIETTEEEAEATGKSIPEWIAFPDTIAAMQALGKKYKIIALSNISRAAWAKTASGPLKDVKFDAVYRAEDIGSYKPDHRNFEYLLNGIQKEFGIEKSKLLHVGHGVKADQVPAEEMGIDHAWIRRGKDNWAETDVPKMEGLLEFETLGDLAKAADA